MDRILIFAGILLAVWGFTDILRHLIFRWLRLRGDLRVKDSESLLIIVRPRSAEDCEFLIRSAAERIRWMDLSEPCRLVCIHENQNSEMEAICSRLSEQFPFLTVSTWEELRPECSGV